MITLIQLFAECGLNLVQALDVRGDEDIYGLNPCQYGLPELLESQGEASLRDQQDQLLHFETESKT